MLTPTDLKNIKTFEDLNPNHKKVFKHRLSKKCILAQKDLEFVLLNYDKLGLKLEKVIDILQLAKLIDTYQDLEKLQNM